MNAGLLPALPPPASTMVGWPWDEETPPSRYRSDRTWPRVSIVTPSFNQGEFIEETLRSLLLQNYPDLQMIVIDGGSTDSTREVLDRYAPWLDHVASEPDAGQSHAIEKGLALCDGAWFNWLNSDDLLRPGALAALVEATDEDTVCVSGRTVNRRGDHDFSSYRARLPIQDHAPVSMLAVNQPGSLLRLAAVRRAGGIRRDLQFVMDLDLWLRLGLRSGFSGFTQIDLPVAVYRYHESSKTCSHDDVFALEQFALLTDLAESRGVKFPDRIVRLRSQCPAGKFDGRDARERMDASTAESEWLHRVLVEDSLLFRAMRKNRNDDIATLVAFADLIESLAPALQGHLRGSANPVVGTALVHAMQIVHRAPPTLAWRALGYSPAWSTLRALLALWLGRQPR